MKALPSLIIAILLTSLVLFAGSPAPEASAAQRKSLPVKIDSDFSVTNLPQGKLYTYIIPKDSKYRARVALSASLQTVSRFYEQNKSPLFVINAGFFDPSNGETTSYVSLDGDVAADPHNNSNLTDNPKLKSYLPRIFNRSELRIIQCGVVIRYDISPHDAKIPAACKLQDAVGGGPALLPKLADREEAFTDTNAKGQITRDPIGIAKPNARSAVGITKEGDLILMMGAQDPEKGKSGFTLQQIADQMKAKGAVKAMSLDGGSSSSIVVTGQAYYGYFDKNKKPVDRRVKSALLVLPR